MARQPDGFALRFRFAAPLLRASPRIALAFCAYLSVGLTMLALAGVPEARAMAASVARAQPAEPESALHPVRPVVTVIRADPPRVLTHVVVADSYHVTPQTVAYNNGLTDTSALREGQVLAIPTIDAALYTVRKGDTVDSLARQFGVASETIAEANRLLYEPDNFAVGATVIVPVPDGRFPNFRLRVTEAPRPAPFARSLTRARLLLPVAGGYITQRFSSFHTAVDVAGPYGAPVLSAEAGTVAAVFQGKNRGRRRCGPHQF